MTPTCFAEQRAVSLDPERIARYRKHLGTVGWYIIPFMANQTTVPERSGKAATNLSSTDEQAVIATMSYVDLNQVRVGLVDRPEDASLPAWLNAVPLVKRVNKASPITHDHNLTTKRIVGFSHSMTRMIILITHSHNSHSKPADQVFRIDQAWTILTTPSTMSPTGSYQLINSSPKAGSIPTPFTSAKATILI